MQFSGRNSPNVVTIGSKWEHMTTVKLIVKTNFSQKQKCQKLELRNVWNATAKFNLCLLPTEQKLSLFKTFLLPTSVKERDFESIAGKRKLNQFILFKFCDKISLDPLIFLGGATSLGCFLKAYKTSDTKRLLSYEWFNHPDKLHNTEFCPCEAFCSKLHSCNSFEAEYKHYVKTIEIEKPHNKPIAKWI